MPNRFKAPSVSTLTAESSLDSGSFVLGIPGAYPQSSRGAQSPMGASRHAPRSRTLDPLFHAQRELDSMRKQHHTVIAGYQRQLDDQRERTQQHKQAYESQSWNAMRDAQNLRHRIQNARRSIDEEQRQCNALLELLDRLRHPYATPEGTSPAPGPAPAPTSAPDAASAFADFGTAPASDPFAAYEHQWGRIWKRKVPQCSYTLTTFPWPVRDFTGIDSITEESLLEFLLHEKRPGVAGKNAITICRVESIRYYPDKFSVFALNCIVVQDRPLAAGVASKIFNLITDVLARYR
ncbi:uncharacterized protein SCHCODRAFT_02598686 [Schizophyllum commune H4-8]|uniref:Uncharacterized protein n=1 Tax=Schizophyllum commune (strain H4-8 / FGSC 9210) TaxID=578458 RepID=D8Q2D1_SCHCM|nr:uncharacterized protein SCHCODRAFT_02598686 [Schizophyllum commune H4-8]KAI5895817.1 hypothetical protein SCHCODRAFT_02598686 [Schizophyllum commune H4-8]